MTTTVYISIGNSDDKLTQREWAAFMLRVHLALDQVAVAMHGSWYSGPASEYQNACWCVEIPADKTGPAKGMLRQLAREYRQDSIAWAVAPATEFIGPPSC